MAYLEFFSEARIALSREIPNHPILVERIQKHRQEDFEVILAEVAVYCGIVLDDIYYPSDLDRLCDILFKKLREKRTSIILSTTIDLPGDNNGNASKLH